MPTPPDETPRPLPDRPDLRHLRDQARDLLRREEAESLTDAQFRIARRYGFASWPKLKQHVESLGRMGELQTAVDSDDADRARALLTADPALHLAPIGYGGNAALTRVAECRAPGGPPSPRRLALARWMIENGSDVHQGGDAPLARAALRGDRIPMMELLLACGAEVNALYRGRIPIILFPCETLDPQSLHWLLDHGADPNCAAAPQPATGTALDSVVESYDRSPALGDCIDLLLERCGATRHHLPVVLDLLRGPLERLAAHIDRDPDLIHRHLEALHFGATGERRLTLRGGTLLHVAAEYRNQDAAEWLLDRGADVNARATLDDAGLGGQTPIFHAVTQFGSGGLHVAQLLRSRGADLSIRARLPGHYDRPEESMECTPLGYAMRFPAGAADNATLTWLRACRATE